MGKHVIIGTAGHVDHGKTVLIKALTGVDTDRLQEEKKRGISIDLGFAPFALPGGRIAGIVDVPGHERFIHNMLAGAAGVDLVLLVVDASEGVMPQTREHLDILQILGIQKGIVVITKIDLVDEEWREMVLEEIAEELAGTFLEQAPMAAVSAINGQGIDELKELIDRSTTELLSRNANAPLRLPVDRSFTIDGFGTVVTGTLIQGSVTTGDTVEIVPPGVQARVRNIQVHDSDVEQAEAGSRVALNLAGIERTEVSRGSVVAKVGYFRETSLIDVSVNLLAKVKKPLKNLEPVHFFLGSARTVGKFLLLEQDDLKGGESALAQCRLESPLVAERGDRFVIRSYSPMTTIGGGKVLEPFPVRHRRFRRPVIEQLQQLEQSSGSAGDAAFICAKFNELIIADMARLGKETRFDQAQLVAIVENLVSSQVLKEVGKSYTLTEKYLELTEAINAELHKYHREYPLSPGISKARVRACLPPVVSQKDYDAIVELMQAEKQLTISDSLVSLAGFKPAPAEKDKKVLDNLTALYLSAQLQPPTVNDAMEKAGGEIKRADQLMNYLVHNNVLVKISENSYIHKEALEKAQKMLVEHFKSHQTITLAEFRDLSSSSRKYAQVILEYFDRVKATKRVDDYRVPLKLNSE